MSLQRIHVSYSGDTTLSDGGACVCYKDHEHVVSIIRDQLTCTQKMLEQSQELVRLLTSSMCEGGIPK